GLFLGTEFRIMRRCDSPMRRIAETLFSIRHISRRLLPCLIALAAGLTGCSGSGSAVPTYEVKGKVLLANGRGLSTGRVTFLAVDGLLPQASGEIQPDGGFALTTRNPGDGAAPGNYKVRIEPAEGKNPKKARPNFPVKYVDEDSSGLAVTVRAEPN